MRHSFFLNFKLQALLLLNLSIIDSSELTVRANKELRLVHFTIDGMPALNTAKRETDGCMGKISGKLKVNFGPFTQKSSKELSSGGVELCCMGKRDRPSEEILTATSLFGKVQRWRTLALKTFRAGLLTQNQDIDGKWSQWGNKNKVARMLGRCEVPTVEINFFWEDFYMALTGLVCG